MNQPDDIGPYPEERECDECRLAEAERRGAERGWDEGVDAVAEYMRAARLQRHPHPPPDEPANPYRKAAQ